MLDPHGAPWLGISSPGREMNGLPTLQSTLYPVPVKPSQGHQGIRRKSLDDRTGLQRPDVEHQLELAGFNPEK